MGNNSSREPRPASSLGRSRSHDAPPPAALQSASQPAGDRLYSSRAGRSSRPDLSFLGLGSTSNDHPPDVTRRETRAEREARKLAKERELRERERERSVRDEGVDGGYLVTLGTYTGPEDFNKQVVRQLMIERRLAPFWKGLNDHDDSWTEHQLVAAVNGLPIPAADEALPELEAPGPAEQKNPKSSDSSLNGLMVPIIGRTVSSTSDASGRLSPGQAAFSMPSSSPIGNASSSSPFFRGRAKTLAALSTSSKNNSQTDMTPQEVMLPKDPYVNGQRTEAFLYRDTSECPICFLYYPPYLNRTRCCDQPICSECFVQIKRPDPHPPEHHDANSSNTSNESHDDYMLVSEPSACPFCVQPEFGVTYESPPFRKGLVYQGQTIHPSAMSSSSSLGSPTRTGTEGARRRGKSLSANAPQVITTDQVRPDWAKKLADARAHALRRSAAATALHNAAYVIGNNPSDSRGFGLGRRRRALFVGDSPSSSGQGTPRNGPGDPLAQLMASSSREHVAERPETGSGRHGSRRSRMEDLEELMMMEAIRLSLAAEEERKKKDDKEAAKEAKKGEKKKAKEAKKLQKSGRKTGFFPIDLPDDDASQAGPSGQAESKGKGIDRSGAGFNPMNEPTSTLNAGAPTSARADPQRHLEESRARIQTQSAPESVGATSPLDPTGPPPHRMALRQVSNTSSTSSSAESETDSIRNTSAGIGSGSSFEPSPNTSGLSLGGGVPPADPTFSTETPPGGGAGTEPMFNFRSLAAVIGREDKPDEGEQAEHIEDTDASAPRPQFQHPTQGPNDAESKTPPSSTTLSPSDAIGTGTRSRGNSGESSASGSGTSGSISTPPSVMITPSSPPPHGNGKAPMLPMFDFDDDVNECEAGETTH